MSREVEVLNYATSARHARRELLWLRAKEKGDDAEAAHLEQADPAIVARLRAAGLEPTDIAGEPIRERRERFGRLWDACYARHAATYFEQAGQPEPDA